MRKWMGAALIGVGLIGSIIAWPRMPAQFTLDYQALWPFAVTNEPMSRLGAALIMPLAAAFTWFLLIVLRTRGAAVVHKRLFGRWAPEGAFSPAAFDRFATTYDSIVLIMVALMIIAHGVLLAIGVGGPAWLVRGFPIVGGLGCLLLGNLMPRVRPNPVMGVRIPRTLRDPLLWARTQRLFGILWFISGIVVILFALTAPRYSVLAGFVAFAISTIVVFVYTLVSENPPRASGTALALFMLTACAAEAFAQTPARPDSIPPAGVIEEAVSFPSGKLTLRGTLALPANRSGALPVAIIVAGSGPTDRNGNGPLTQTNLYRQLAWQLAQRGIASFRYDKRGITNVGEINHAEVVVSDFVDDVASAATRVRSDTRFGKLFLIGHSEGAQLVLQAANRGTRTDGIIMASGMGRPLAQVLHDQFALQIEPAKLVLVDTAFQKFLRGEDIGDVPVMARMVFVPIYRKMIASMAAYDPIAEIKRAAVPVMIVHGDTDLQTTGADYDRLRAARPDAHAVLIPNANHVFKRVASRDVAVQQPTYQNASLPIVQELSEAIAAWILRGR